MVTRGNINLIKTSYRGFKLQTYTNKELVIVFDKPNDELRQLVKDDSEVVLVEVEPNYTLGKLRNISVSNASGEFICQWDDDDLYAPERISICMHVLQSSNADAVFLKRWILWWEKRKLLSVSNYTAWEGSIFAKKSIMIDYPPMSKGEDTFMTVHLQTHHKCKLFDTPQLYCYRITGENTWDETFHENLFSNASKVYTPEEFESVFKFPCFIPLNE